MSTGARGSIVYFPGCREPRIGGHEDHWACRNLGIAEPGGHFPAETGT
jgi:hypothetical protein